MKKFLFIFLFASLSSYAQVTTDSIKRQDSIRRANLKLKAAEIRKQIDSLKAIEKSIKKKLTKKDSLKIWSGEGRFTFLLNQSAYSNWISGGENTVAAGMVVNYDFNYKKNKWKWDNKIISSYGSSYIANQGYRKTDDRFEYNSVLAYNTGKSWYYSFFSNFITQYSNGFEFSDDSRERVSTFFSPAYWSYGPGVLWRKNENYRINIAPATSRFTFVAEAFSGEYGVEEGETSNYGLGFNLSSYVKFKILDNLTMENIIQMYADYLEKPQNVDVNYQINLFLSFTKRLSTNITFHAIVDDNAVNMLQFRQLFGLGFNYTFHKI